MKGNKNASRAKPKTSFTLSADIVDRLDAVIGNLSPHVSRSAYVDHVLRVHLDGFASEEPGIAEGKGK